MYNCNSSLRFSSMLIFILAAEAFRLTLQTKESNSSIPIFFTSFSKSTYFSNSVFFLSIVFCLCFGVISNLFFNCFSFEICCCMSIRRLAASFDNPLVDKFLPYSKYFVFNDLICASDAGVSLHIFCRLLLQE